MTTREALHALIDALPERKLPAAEYALNTLQTVDDTPQGPIPVDDPLWLAFQNAPEDDEPLTPEEIASIEEGKAEIARGEGIPWEVVRERLRRIE